MTGNDVVGMLVGNGNGDSDGFTNGITHGRHGELICGFGI